MVPWNTFAQETLSELHLRMPIGNLFKRLTSFHYWKQFRFNFKQQVYHWQQEDFAQQSRCWEELSFFRRTTVQEVHCTGVHMYLRPLCLKDMASTKCTISASILLLE